ncbi:MAG: nucleotidyl transferase AbiEii/AbiGii toxin family protein [Prevotellaceae bacterium]|jgi:predicted nucleotidyltransferase component of viral defense system|nr:nucleotidyl transferase AbiEii/AbiGii toxin family protein [Prevotellaceae bacterium]
MINRAAILQWRTQAPWNTGEQVEQDLIISRALIAIFSDEFLASQLAFRGGTALHKLYLSPQSRYSEDIDLVQINAGQIKPILSHLGDVLDFLPGKVVKQKRYNNTMLFRMESEIPPVVPIRLKIEINCFEHFNELGLVKVPFSMENSWFSGNCELTTYTLNELLGTKLRALYQRKKGRDLFDLYKALSITDADPEVIIRCYKRYMDFSVSQPPTYKQFILNMESKMADPDFWEDMDSLIRPEETYNAEEAYQVVKERIIDKLMK